MHMPSTAQLNVDTGYAELKLIMREKLKVFRCLGFRKELLRESFDYGSI